MVPLVEAIHAASDVVISVDTFNAEVARLSIEAGASVINDTSGLYDPEHGSSARRQRRHARAYAQPRAAAQRAAVPAL